MNKNSDIDLYVCNTYDVYMNLKNDLVKDKSLAEVEQSASFYFNYSNRIEKGGLFLLVDKKQNKLLNYAFVESDRKLKDCLYIDFIQTPLVKNMKKGYASLMLDYISDYARKEGYRKIHLMALGRNPRYLYYKKGFVNESHPNKMSVFMYKYLDEKDWACSVLIHEALNNSNQYISPSQTLYNIIKLKQYDNMFEYGVIKENEYGDKKTNPVEVFTKWDKLANRLYNTNPTIKAFCKIFDSPITKKNDYKEKMSLLKTYFSENKKEQIHCDNILEGLDLLRTSKSFDDDVKRIELRKQKFQNMLQNNIVNGKEKTETQPKISTKQAKILNISKKESRETYMERSYKG